jgi:outer membrane protein TolC
VLPLLEGEQSLEQCIAIAVQQNPEIRAAQKRLESLAHQVTVAGSLQDPMLNITAQPEPVQTAAGQQELILAANQRFPWFGKLQTQAGMATARRNAQHARLVAVELEITASVKRAYYELYYVQRAQEVTEAERDLLREIREVANTRYATGQTSQQDVLRADLEISSVENDLIQLRQQMASAQARLARLLHVSPQSDLLAANDLPLEQVPQDVEMLQQIATSARPELHAQLAEVRADILEARMARLNYRPDVTLGMSWIDTASAGISPVANGRDAVLLTAGFNLPVYHTRLDASVRSAEAEAVATARQYDALRDMTLEQVTDLFAQARSQQELVELFDQDILPKARQTLEVSTRAYNVGEVDFLQLLDNWRQLLRYELNYRRLEASRYQTLAELERVVGSTLGPG